MPNEDLEYKILNGLFSNLSFREMQKNLAGIMKQLRETPPYSNDPGIQELADRVNHLKGANDYRKICADLNMYFAKLRATRRYELFSTRNLMSENIGPSIPVLCHPDLVQLETTPYKWYTPIGPDGNCYYRMFYLGYLEKALTESPENRALMINQLANLIETQLIDNQSSLFNIDFREERICDRHQNPIETNLPSLVKMLRQAANDECWETLQEFRKELYDKSNLGIDTQLIIALRYLVAQYLIKHQGIPCNELSLRDAYLTNNLPSSADTMPQYCREQITPMGLETEGLHVELNILPAMLRCTITIIVLNPANSAKNWINLAHQNAAFTQSIIDEYCNYPFPHKEITCVLTKNHYNLVSIEEERLSRIALEIRQRKSTPTEFIDYHQYGNSNKYPLINIPTLNIDPNSTFNAYNRPKMTCNRSSDSNLEQPNSGRPKAETPPYKSAFTKTLKKKPDFFFSSIDAESPRKSDPISMHIRGPFFSTMQDETRSSPFVELAHTEDLANTIPVGSSRINISNTTNRTTLDQSTLITEEYKEIFTMQFNKLFEIYSNKVLKLNQKAKENRKYWLVSEIAQTLLDGIYKEKMVFEKENPSTQDSLNRFMITVMKLIHAHNTNWIIDEHRSFIRTTIGLKSIVECCSIMFNLMNFLIKKTVHLLTLNSDPVFKEGFTNGLFKQPVTDTRQQIENFKTDFQSMTLYRTQ